MLNFSRPESLRCEKIIYYQGIIIYTLSGSTGSALAWNFEGRTFAAR